MAVDPPREVCERLAAWARVAVRGMAGGDAIRVLGPELLHVTLCFLGSRPADEIDDLARRLSECERPAVELSLGAPLWLPRRRPRALAVEVHDEDCQLERLQASVRSELEEGTEHGARRRFRPHVTVARRRGQDTARERALPPTPAARFAVGEVVLYRSWLSPEGAGYEPLASYALG